MDVMAMPHGLSLDKQSLLNVVTLEEAVKVLKADLASRTALESCVAAMAAEERLNDHSSREVVYRAARQQDLVGVKFATFLLEAMTHPYRVATLVDKSPECQLNLLGHDIGIKDGPPNFPDACDVIAIRGSSEYVVVAGRRLLIDMLMDPASFLPPVEGPNPIWRAVQIERFVTRVRELGLTAPPVDEEKLGECEPLGISFGEAMTDVRGGESRKWSVARFRVVHRGLTYRCRFVRPADPATMGFDEPDYVECDPRFATAPSGSGRYIAPNPSPWGYRGATSLRRVVTPFGHVVQHVRRGDMGSRLQTPYDLLSAIKAYSAAWKAGPQKSPARFMELVERLGMSGWFHQDPHDARSWKLIYERFGVSLDVRFHEHEDGAWKAKLQFCFGESDLGCTPVWIRTPRRFYELVRDALWLGADGRKQYKPGDVAPWVSAMHEDRPVDDGVG